MQSKTFAPIKMPKTSARKSSVNEDKQKSSNIVISDHVSEPISIEVGEF